MRTALSARLLVLAAIGAGAAFSGCRTGSPLYSRYNNFRAYYNTYYNASQSLEEGERALERQAVTVDRNQLVPVFPVTATTPTSGPFQDAIDKSAELLRNRPTSKWADDALMVIGKSYFYQRNFVGAEQKFRETMAAAELVDDRRLGDEARFWLGRTYAAADRFEEGVQVLAEGLADEGGDRYWRSRMQLAIGELYARAGRWDEAAEALREGAPEEGDADVAARAFVLLGQVEEHAERWQEAADAYAEALRRRPAYELSYAAEVGRALVLGLEAGRTDEALEGVRAMRADDKNYDRRGELALVEARLRTAAGEDASALALYRDVLYDQELSGQAVRGQAHYRLAEFYRDRLGDYVRASAHFDTAATALRAPISDVRPARGAILGVAAEAQTYSALAETARQIAEADSLLALGDLSDEDFRARIEAIEAERRRVYLDEQRRLDAARTAQQFSGGGLPGVRGQTETAVVSTQADQAVAGASDAGFLSHRAPASIQAGLIAFQQVWGDRPLVPNWRRRAAVQAGDVTAAAGVVGTQVDGGIGLGDGPARLDLTAVPRTPAKRAELVTELAALRYELANAFFLSINRADTAAALYRSILADTPDLPVAVRARYALAEIERSAGREDIARPLYEAVAAADTSALGRASRVRLGLETADEPAPVAVETSLAYDVVRRRWTEGDPLGAAQAFVALGDRDPDAADAPRAYLSAAVAYVEWAGRDSLALSRPLPDSLVSSELRVVADSLARIEVATARVERAEARARAAEMEVEPAPSGEPVPAEVTPTEPVAVDLPATEEPEDAPEDRAPPVLSGEPVGDPEDEAPLRVPLPAERPAAQETTPVDAVPIDAEAVAIGGETEDLVDGDELQRPVPSPADSAATSGPLVDPGYRANPDYRSQTPETETDDSLEIDDDEMIRRGEEARRTEPVTEPDPLPTPQAEPVLPPAEPVADPSVSETRREDPVDPSPVKRIPRRDPLAAPPAAPVQAVAPEPGAPAPPAPAPQPRVVEAPAPADPSQRMVPLPIPTDSTFTLRHHLRALAARYPGTPYATRAAVLIADLPALPDVELEPLPDSLMAPVLPALAADSLSAGPDSVSAEAPGAEAPTGSEEQGTPNAGNDLSVSPEVAAAMDRLRGEAPIEPAQGGVTWRVRTLSIPDEGEQMARVLRDAGFRVAILQDPGGTGYAIALGQFEDEAQAEAARDGLPAWAQRRGEIIALDGFTVVPDNDGEGP